IAPCGKTQFYKYKKQLQPLKEELIRQLTLKALEVLQGNAIKAAEVITGLLENNNPHIRLPAAREVLDRTVGQPKKQETFNQNITQIGIIGVTNEDLRRLVEPSNTIV
ncbi:MAG: hypothetical protein ABIJ85_03530, partial [bacterium]